MVVPSSSYFEALAVIFSAMSLVKIKSMCIWAVKYEAIKWKNFFQVIQMEKPGVENLFQKQLCRGVLSESCSESMHQIYRRTLMPKCDFSKVAKELYWITPRYGCSPLNLLHTFRTPFTKNTSGWFLLLINHKNTKQM